MFGLEPWSSLRTISIRLDALSALWNYSPSPASRRSTLCPARARFAANGPPPGPEPTTIYSYVALGAIAAFERARLERRKTRDSIATDNAQ